MLKHKLCLATHQIGQLLSRKDPTLGIERDTKSMGKNILYFLLGTQPHPSSTHPQFPRGKGWKCLATARLGRCGSWSGWSWSGGWWDRACGERFLLVKPKLTTCGDSPYPYWLLVKPDFWNIWCCIYRLCYFHFGNLKFVGMSWMSTEFIWRHYYKATVIHGTLMYFSANNDCGFLVGDWIFTQQRLDSPAFSKWGHRQLVDFQL